MSSPALVVLMTLGAGILALWLDVRFRGYAPRRAGIMFLHLAVALATAQFLAPALVGLLLRETQMLPLELAALFAIFLPALVYAFLSGIWILRALQAALQPR